MKDIENLAELLARLKSDGIPPSEYHIHIDRFLSFKARAQGIPYSGTFELTPLCNLDCRMCYVHLTRDQLKGKKLLMPNQWKSIMTQAQDAGMVKAKLTGGECLTYPGFDELYLHLHSMGIQVNVLTNGILLNEERIRFFKEHPAYGIQVTLYGAGEDTYERVTGKRLFSCVCNNIRAAIDADLPVSLAITPSRFMEDSALELVDMAQSLGVPYTINAGLFEPRADTGRRECRIDADLDTYIKMYKRQLELQSGVAAVTVHENDLPMPNANGDLQEGIRCAAGMGAFEIDWQGNMYACTSLRSISADPLKERFAAAWDKIHKGALCYPVPAECRNCPYETVCVTCPAAHEQNGSSAHCNTYYCMRVKRLVQEGIIKLP